AETRVGAGGLGRAMNVSSVNLPGAGIVGRPAGRRPIGVPLDVMLKPPADWTERSHDLSRLLARAGVGDRAAFATLYERTSSHLLGVVLRINRDRAQAEDILQEVYVNVWRAAKSFDAAQSQPLTWLTSIARNRAIDSLRRGQARPQIQTTSGSDSSADAEDESVYDTVADSAPGPLDLLSRASEARALAACMDQLSAQQRQGL